MALAYAIVQQGSNMASDSRKIRLKMGKPFKVKRHRVPYSSQLMLNTFGIVDHTKRPLSNDNNSIFCSTLEIFLSQPFILVLLHHVHT